MQTHGNTVLEVSWTIIPFLILAVMAVPTVATIFDLAKIPKGPDVVHVDGRRPAVVLAVRVHRQGQRVLHGERDAHPGRPARCSLTAHERQRHPLVLGPRARRQEGCRARPPEHAHDRGRPARHLPRPVRRVLRHLARQHAAAGDRPDRRPTTTRGSRRRRPRCPRPTVAEFDEGLATQVGLRELPLDHEHQEGRRRDVGPNLTHLGDRAGVRGRHLPDEARQPHQVDLRRARARSPTGTAQAARMPAFSDARHDEGRSRADRQVPAVRHRRPIPQSHPECR